MENIRNIVTMEPEEFAAKYLPVLEARDAGRTIDKHSGRGTLVFEGAGWSGADISRATIGNCRIRTAFHLDDGRRVYLEMIGSKRGKHSGPRYEWPYTGFVEFCHEITDDSPNDDCNRHGMIPQRKCTTFEWSLNAILAFVNGLGASFDAVEVAPDYAGYRVFRDYVNGKRVYNYGDEFTVDHDLCERRAAKVAEMRAINEARFGQEYDNTSYWAEGDKLMMRLNVSRECLKRNGITERLYVLMD